MISPGAAAMLKEARDEFLQDFKNELERQMHAGPFLVQGIDVHLFGGDIMIRVMWVSRHNLETYSRNFAVPRLEDMVPSVASTLAHQVAASWEYANRSGRIGQTIEVDNG